MADEQSIGRGSRLSWLFEPVLFVLLALASTWPLATQIDNAIPTGQERLATVPLFNQWTVWWNADRAAEGVEMRGCGGVRRGRLGLGGVRRGSGGVGRGRVGSDGVRRGWTSHLREDRAKHREHVRPRQPTNKHHSAQGEELDEVLWRDRRDASKDGNNRHVHRDGIQPTT